jgi:hypothetical protein
MIFLISCADFVRVVSCEFVVPVLGYKTGTANSDESTLNAGRFKRKTRPRRRRLAAVKAGGRKKPVPRGYFLTPDRFDFALISASTSFCSTSLVIKACARIRVILSPISSAVRSAATVVAPSGNRRSGRSPYQREPTDSFDRRWDSGGGLRLLLPPTPHRDA